MATLKSKDGNHLWITCMCGCDEGIRFVIDKDDFDYYCFMTYTNGSFYVEQGRGWRKKLKKLWAIIRNKDFYYSEVILTKDDFAEFKKYINSIE